MPKTPPDLKREARGNSPVFSSLHTPSSDSATKLALVTGEFVAPSAASIATPPSLLDADAETLLGLLMQKIGGVGSLLKTNHALPLPVLERLVADWLFQLRHAKQRSPRTLESYEWSVRCFFDFLRVRGASTCGEEQLKEFFDYLAVLGGEKDFRFVEQGIAVVPLIGAKKPGARARQLIFINLRVFFNWAVKQGMLSESPLGKMSPPPAKAKKVQPFTPDQVLKLLAAAKVSDNARRDVALLMLLFDCGLRVQEACDLCVEDVDWGQRTLLVRHGKGDKERTVVFSPETMTSLWNYLRDEPRLRGTALFRSQRGSRAGGHMTRSGVRLLFKRLGDKAGVGKEFDGARCSPHTMRHAFASMYLTHGGSIEDLQKMLGHSTTQMSMHYVKTNTEYLQQKHLRHSPVSQLFRKK